MGDGAEGPGKGSARGYSWEPFQPGHTLSTVHGADSDRQVVPLAQEIVERFTGSGYCPDYLRTMPQFTPAVQAWAKLEARARLLGEWLSGMTPDEMTTPRKAGGSSPVEIWLAAERAASRARERLGLDPASWAKLAKDLGWRTVPARMRLPGWVRRARRSGRSARRTCG